MTTDRPKLFSDPSPRPPVPEAGGGLPPFFPPVARRRVAIALAILFGGGVLAHAWTPLRPLALALTTPLLLLANGAVLLAVFDDSRAPRLRIWCLAAWALTVTLEIVGVATGHIFGAYHYGPTLRGQVAGVPLLIGLNWVTLLLGAVALLETGLPSSLPPLVRWWLVPLASALLLVAFDWIMEPIAVELRYWHWASWPQIPIRNYAAWLVIALFLTLTLRVLRISVGTKLARFYLLLQLAFFGLLRAFL